MWNTRTMRVRMLSEIAIVCLDVAMTVSIVIACWVYILT